MRPLWAMLIVLLLAIVAKAQAPYPSTAATPPAWGGQALPARIPYQPTLVGAPAPNTAAQFTGYGLPPAGTQAVVAGPSTAGPAYTLQGPVALPADPSNIPGAGTAWQPYPEVAPPAAGPLSGPPPSIFPTEPSSGLRPLPRPADARDGVFQKAKLTTTWIPQLDEDSLGWTDVRSEIVFGLPFFTRETPILITPSYELHFVESPNGTDLPPRLHDVVIDFNHFRRVANDWIANIAVAPGYYADDHSFDSDDALRFNGRALAIYDPTPEWKGVLGVTYVHGGWAKIVPVAGVVYEPTADVKYELVFPRPRVAWRLPQSPVPGRDEFWFYILGEFANAIWAYEQIDGTPDTFAYRDWRVMLGLERKIIGGLSHRVELGYVFNREFKLARNGDEVDLDDSFLLRAGIVY
jgi:hypothetical protein